LTWVLEIGKSEVAVGVAFQMMQSGNSHDFEAVPTVLPAGLMVRLMIYQAVHIPKKAVAGVAWSCLVLMTVYLPVPQ
jgi:hypothetical protein